MERKVVALVVEVTEDHDSPDAVAEFGKVLFQSAPMRVSDTEVREPAFDVVVRSYEVVITADAPNEVTGSPFMRRLRGRGRH